MNAAVYHGPGDIRVEKVSDPKLEADGIIIQIKACGICGSDIHRWKIGGVKEARMEVGQVLGHEFSGEVVEVGANVRKIEKGQRVVAIGVGLRLEVPGGFAEYVSIPLARLKRTVFLLPDEISYEEGAMLEPLVVGISAAKKGNPTVQDTVAILGMGIIGQCTAQVLKAIGVSNIIASEIGKKRLALAKTIGAADIVINALEEDPIERVLEATSGVGADVVVECAGVPATFHQAVDMVRPSRFDMEQKRLIPGGKVVLTAIYERPIEWLPNRLVFYNIDLLGMMGGEGTFPAAIDLVKTGKVDLKPLISHVFPLDQAREAFDTHIKTDESVKILIKP
ncbi:MAG: zinc-binding dehydrogenase [Deltaproteobacteria bacterium]|nr:zinc-binding dehydrogenase [Deltaproteobacteria bacterium]